MPSVTSSQLKVNQEIPAQAPDATLVVTMDPRSPLAVGTYVFQLVVHDKSGTASKPTQFSLVIS